MQSAYCTGVKASYIALAGISWKKVKSTEAPFNVHWTFSQFKIMWLRRCDLMATNMWKLQNKETIILHIFWERDASRGVFKGSTIPFCKILIFVNLNSKMIELKRSVSRWTNLRRRFHLSHDARRVLSIQKGLVDLSIILEKPDHWSFWFQRYVDHIEPSTPRTWRTTTQASAILEASKMAPFIEFFVVAMERFLVELMTIQRKSTNEHTCKATW